MRGRLGMLLTVLTAGLTPTAAHATPQDIASTHAYLVAGHTALQAVVGTWSRVEASMHRLDERFRAECPNVGAGSPQSEEEQKLSYEVAGALWATGYHTDIGIVRKFVRAVKPLKWSNGAITRSARNFARGLTELSSLQVPNLCADIRAWSATGFKTIPQSTLSFDQRVEPMEAKEVPPSLLTPYVQPADQGLFATDKRLNTRFEELEIGQGVNDWDTLLEILGLNQ